MSAGQEPARPHGPTAGWTTQRWLRVGVGVSLTVLALLSGLGVWAMNRAASITEDLVDRRSPALINSVRLETALVNQETGIRGYGLSGREDFLQPYRQGRADEKTAVDRLHVLLAGNAGGLADLRTVLDRAGTWQRTVAVPISGAPAGAPVKQASAGADQGKATFDRLRRAMTAQQDHLRDARASAANGLSRAELLRDRVFIAIGLVILLLAVVVFEGLRRGVTGPLTRLSADAARVTLGDFSHHITATGPADVRRLGADMESMRRRLADELATSEEHRRLLDEQAADLKRSNAELEQFAYVASHDLQEPLRKVSSFSQLLQRRYAGQLDERADQYIAYAVDGANRMQTLINDLLAFSRVGRVHGGTERIDLGALFDRTTDAISIAIAESGAKITRDELPVVVGDSTQLGVLWQNLVSNAVKFRHPDRAPEIRVTVERQDGFWRFTVTDNGIGVEPEFAERIFVIFQRLHTKDRYPGSGIGLAMCRKIVEYYGGTIGVETAPGPGTRIAFTLPVAGPEEPAGDPAEQV